MFSQLEWYVLYVGHGRADDEEILKRDLRSDLIHRKSSRALTFENVGMLIMGAPIMIFCPSTSRCVVEHRLR